MSTHEGESAAKAAPAPEVAVLTCPNCGRTVATRDDLVCVEHPGPWEVTVDQAEMDKDMAEFGIAPGMVGPAMTRIVRLEYVGCVRCYRSEQEPVKVVVH